MNRQHPDNIDADELYHENSKLRRIDQDHFAWISFVGMSPEIKETMLRPYKIYRGAPRITIPNEPHAILKSELSFDEVIFRRVSDRSFKGSASFEQTAKILHYGYGVTRRDHLPGNQASDHPVENLRFRAVPSGGALYPLEVYLFALDISGLEKGLYHYNTRDSVLEFLREGDFRERLADIAFSTDILSGAAGFIVLSAVFQRSRFKYRKQAYRFVLFEAGHVSQNMMLAAASQKLGTVAVGGFIDDELNHLLDIDGLDESAIYLLAFGKKG